MDDDEEDGEAMQSGPPPTVPGELGQSEFVEETPYTPPVVADAPESSSVHVES